MRILHKQVLRYLQRKRFVFSLLLLGPLSLQPAQAQNPNDKPLRREKIMLNIAADAIAIWPSWRADIDSLGRDEIISTLRKYVDEYAGSQVTTLFYNVNYQRAAYDSKIMTPYWELPPGVKVNEWAAYHDKMHRKNVDPFEVCIRRSRERKISPWLSIRMNDHHYWNDTTKLSRFVMENRHLWISQHAFLNYGKKEVRDYYMSFISEALDKYDVDGVELDWIRTNTLFKDGTPQEWIVIINEFMRDVKAMIDKKAAQRRHPIRIATRVLPTPAINETYGLDGVAWVKNGWTDILIPGNWHNPVYFDIPVEEWKQRIGPGHRYLIAPSADMWYSMQKDAYSKIMRVDLQTMRAFAIGSFARGADAIYLFNHFNYRDYERKNVHPDGSTSKANDRKAVFMEIGAANTVKATPRRHPLTFLDPAGRNKKSETPFPATITEKETSFRVYTGPKPAKGRYTILLGLEKEEGFETAALQVKVNGVAATALPDLVRDKDFVYSKTKKWDQVLNISEVGARVVAFEANSASVQPGHNIITITNLNNNKQVAIWLEVKID